MEQSRLFKIVYHLWEKGKSTVPELAEKFEVSVRTIYRDFDAIRSSGIPIYAAQGKGGGIFIMQDLSKKILNMPLYNITVGFYLQRYGKSCHREIYLNTTNRVEKSKLKTILRYVVK